MKSFDCLNPTTLIQGHHMLEASAGTGKTFAIEHIAVRLLLQGVPIERIVVVTFMRAAARELKVRIRMTVRAALAALRGEGAVALPYLRALLKEDDEVRQRALLLLEQANASLDEAPIFTIHGFCYRMLSEYAFASYGGEVGLGPIRQQVEDILRTRLFPDQFSAAQMGLLFQHCRYDKENLISKVVALIEKKSTFPSYPTFEDSYLSFCMAVSECPTVSAQDLQKVAPFFSKMCLRSGEIKPHFCQQIDAFRSTCLRPSFDALLREKELFLTWIDPANQKKRLRAPLPAQAASFFHLKEKIEPIINRAKNPLHTLARLAKICRKQVEEVEPDLGAFFPDEIVLAMKNKLESPSFLHQVASRYDAAIIDEFQDTDAVQWAIFKKLFVDQPISTLYLVGDPKQSIYSFRDADITTYLAAAEEIKSMQRLTTNYRSEPKLLTMLNALFSENPTWLSMTCPEVEIPKTAVNSSFPDDKKPLHIVLLNSDAPLADVEQNELFPFLAAEIEFLITQAHITPKNIALLVRDRYQSERLQSFLKKKNIPTLSKGEIPLTETASYSLFETLLRAIEDPTHQGRLHTLASHPLIALQHSAMKKEKVLLALQTVLHAASKRFNSFGFASMMAYLLDEPWMEKATLETCLVKQGGIEAFADFREVLSFLLEKTSISALSLKELQEALHALRRESPPVVRKPLGDEEAVSIMTIHKSKGLEFDIVFPLGLLTPQRQREGWVRQDKKWVKLESKAAEYDRLVAENQAESLRMTYVALTRAKKRLYLPAHLDPARVPEAKETSSALELFLSKLPPLQEVARRVGASCHRPTFIAKAARSKEVALTPPHKHHLAFSQKPLVSFSTLAKPHVQGRTPSIEEEGLPKGAETGLFLHALFETIFREQKHAAWNPLSNELTTLLQQAHLELWEDEVKEIVRSALACPLQGFSLDQVCPTQCFPEVEFAFKEEKHIVKGFIDLVFCYRKRYYIIDWKSNALDDYGPVALERAMKESDYFLQASLYREALQRYLLSKGKPPVIGGVFYLFLRGLPQGKGVYSL